MREMTLIDIERDKRYPLNARRLRGFDVGIYDVYDQAIIYCGHFIGRFIDVIIRQKFINRLQGWAYGVIYGRRINAFGMPVPNIEYYLIGGRLKIRKFQGIAGAWKTVGGKQIRIEQGSKKNAEHIVDDAAEMADMESEVKRMARIKAAEKDEQRFAKGVDPRYNKIGLHRWDSEADHSLDKYYKEMKLCR